MDSQTREKYLKLALQVFGVIFIVGIYLMMTFIWPSGWSWEPHQPEYEQMIVGVYAVMGIFMLMAARNPGENRLFISFVAWSSAAHGAIMLVQALMDSNESANLLGDIPALFLVAIVLLVLSPKKGA